MTDTVRAIRIAAFGGPQEMRLETLPTPEPGAGEVRLRMTAIGINLIDTYHRTGLYPLPLPTGLGCEGAGIVEAIGAGVDTVKPGQRVAFAMALGAYAEALLVPAHALVAIPDSVNDAQAAAVLLKGMTVDYLFSDTVPLSGGETVLFHAAAGGVGLLACQWARHLGVTLIGTASTPEKCALAEHHGAHQCLLSGDADLSSQLKAIAGNGFPVVYDSVGKDSYRLSLEALAPLGTLVSFGNASGPIDAVVPADLAAAGSVYFTRPTLATHMARPGWMQQSAGKIFDMVARGELRVEVNQTYTLEDVAQAHIDLEARKTTGCSLILPAG